jgi:hypothetical protein
VGEAVGPLGQRRAELVVLGAQALERRVEAGGVRRLRMVDEQVEAEGGARCVAHHLRGRGKVLEKIAARKGKEEGTP